MCRSVCKAMVTADPARRMTAEDAMKNVWVNLGRRRSSSSPMHQQNSARPSQPPSARPSEPPTAGPSSNWPFDKENFEAMAQNEALQAEVANAHAGGMQGLQDRIMLAPKDPNSGRSAGMLSGRP